MIEKKKRKMITLKKWLNETKLVKKKKNEGNVNKNPEIPKYLLKKKEMHIWF